MGTIKWGGRLHGRGNVSAGANIDATQGALPGFIVNNGTAALGTADLNAQNGGLVARTQGGTVSLGLRLNGTVYYFLSDGNL